MVSYPDFSCTYSAVADQWGTNNRGGVLRRVLYKELLRRVL